MKDLRLIINADDLGYDPAVTRGILESMRQGVVSSATFMVNTPFSEEAAQQARGLRLGLHLNLARWRPVASAFPASLLKDGELVEARAGELPAEVVEAEALAQLDRLTALLGAPATHIDVHKHLHRNAGALEGLIAAARARRLPVRAIDSTMRQRLRAAGVRTTDHFIGDADRDAYWTPQRMTEHLASLEEGVTELMCHPGYAPSHVKSGYAAQREIELATFCAAQTKEQLRQSGIGIISFAEL